MRDLQNPTVLKDALYNCAADSGATDDYRRGLIVGIASALVATGWTLRQAVEAMLRNHPSNLRAGAILPYLPEPWRDDETRSIAIELDR